MDKHFNSFMEYVKSIENLDFETEENVLIKQKFNRYHIHELRFYVPIHDFSLISHIEYVAESVNGDKQHNVYFNGPFQDPRTIILNKKLELETIYNYPIRFFSEVAFIPFENILNVKLLIVYNFGLNECAIFTNHYRTSCYQAAFNYMHIVRFSPDELDEMKEYISYMEYCEKNKRKLRGKKPKNQNQNRDSVPSTTTESGKKRGRPPKKDIESNKRERPSESAIVIEYPAKSFEPSYKHNLLN